MWSLTVTVALSRSHSACTRDMAHLWRCVCLLTRYGTVWQGGWGVFCWILPLSSSNLVLKITTFGLVTQWIVFRLLVRILICSATVSSSPPSCFPRFIHCSYHRRLWSHRAHSPLSALLEWKRPSLIFTRRALILLIRLLLLWMCAIANFNCVLEYCVLV